VSETGLRLRIKGLPVEQQKAIYAKRSDLDLIIYMPLRARPVRARAEIMWSSEPHHQGSDDGRAFDIGLSYSVIDAVDRFRIISYARRLKWLPRIAMLSILLLSLALFTLSFYHIRSVGVNKLLVRRIVSVSVIKSRIERQLNEIKVRKDMFESGLSKGAADINSLESEMVSAKKRSYQEKLRLKSRLEQAASERERLKFQIDSLSAGQEGVDSMAYAVTQSRLFRLNSDVELLQMELEEVIKKAGIERQALEERLQSLQQENEVLKKGLNAVREDESLLEEQLAELRYTTGDIEKAGIERMFEWVKLRQVKRTGLVLSYEGDPSLKDWAFIYDQALATQIFLFMDEPERSKAVLDFFNNTAVSNNGMFYNAYDAKTGDPREYTIHSGPNIWVAVAACQYTYWSGKTEFLEMAEGIALKMIDMQAMSPDGSISGGPGIDWVSTEHNIDAYALFRMLYRLTNKQVYADAALKALNWLKTSGYNSQEARFMRGKGDATIATDTFSWAIAAIGPKVLLANGMNPDGIMEFAEKECRVQAKFCRPEGRVVDVTGFDFSRAGNVGRGGIVSTEWTSQMIVALKIMADYYKALPDPARQNVYDSKAAYYLVQLGQMVISSPSPTGQGQGCLPCASIDNVDTGHGWRVASGRRTGSVAGTVYYIFAYTGYNPMAFDIGDLN
jgi:FtsZ-binding cell division protein ZapB